MKLETTINTIRHAHTAYNSEKRYAGTIDIPLSKKGIQDARIAAKVLSKIDFDVVICSKLSRSIETARILAGEKRKLIISSLCNERNFGIMEGHTWNDVRKYMKDILFIRVGNDLHSVNAKGSEPFEKVWERAKKFKRILLKNYQGANVLVVSHGVFLQMFHGVMCNSNCIESLAQYPSNLELTKFRFKGKLFLEQQKIKLIKKSKDEW